MPKPQSDGGDINFGMEQVQGLCVANHVGSYSLPGQILAERGGSANRLLQKLVRASADSPTDRVRTLAV
jgi:hypothetical protein